LKEFLIFFEGNSGQKKEKIRKLPSSEMEALIVSNKCQQNSSVLISCTVFVSLFLHFLYVLHFNLPSYIILYNYCTRLTELTERYISLTSFFQVISCSCFSQSALRKGCPSRNPFCYIHSIISFVILYETS
jgi:hypothetical protein